MPNVQQFACADEIVTATMTLPLDTGEHFGPPLTVGFYPGQAEIWIEVGQERQNIPIQHLPTVIRQLRRAAKMAVEHSAQQGEGGAA